MRIPEVVFLEKFEEFKTIASMYQADIAKFNQRKQTGLGENK
jgi:hypothetical protein